MCFRFIFGLCDVPSDVTQVAKAPREAHRSTEREEGGVKVDGERPEVCLLKYGAV